MADGVDGGCCVVDMRAARQPKHAACPRIVRFRGTYSELLFIENERLVLCRRGCVVHTRGLLANQNERLYLVVCGWWNVCEPKRELC